MKTRVYSLQSLDERLKLWAGGVLCGVPARSIVPSDRPGALKDFAHRHGIGPVLAQSLAEQRADLADCILSGRDRRQLIANEVIREEEFAASIKHIESVLDERAVVFKGQALGYNLYEQSWLRPRCDIDLLVEEQQVPAAMEAFNDLGYRRMAAIDGDLILQQAAFHKRSPYLEHVWDLHWALSNRPGYSGFLDAQTIRAGAVPTPVDGAAVLTPNPVHSLLIACIHLIGHHPREARLIWLYDIHLLTASMSHAQEELFLEQARRRPEIQAACHAALQLTAKYLPAPRNSGLCRELDPGTRSRGSIHRRRLGGLLDDARALSAGRRLRFIRQHAFPSPEYMTKRFHIRHRWQLPYWYAARIGRAIPKLFRRV